ncbi:MAG: zinc-binding metallopeptidase family protein [Acidimicrobiales bacterium]
MRAFICKRCRELATFESSQCRICGALLGFDPLADDLETLEAIDGSLAPPGGKKGQWVRCPRAGLAACNWLLPLSEAGKPCTSCRLTGNLPKLSDREYCDAFAKAEMAKRRLIYQLLQLGLPIVGRDEDPEGGLCFELLASDRHVVTGHHNGVVTIDLNETDDAFREQTRAQFGEPYRTLLGHFRHEIGHYYWSRLVHQGRPASAIGPLLEEARQLFGDERADYEGALHHHYSAPEARPDWGDHYVSAYAAMHPLEDWAETFAHYLHIWDAVQTAASFGVLVVGPVDDRTGRRDPAKASVPSEETASLEGFDAVIADWSPLTVALNALNRSLGKDDLYPFHLPPAVTAKLAFVHKVITSSASKL